MNFPKAVVVNGAGGVGKDTFAECVRRHLTTFDKNALIFSSVDRVKIAARYLGWDEAKDEKGRKFLSDLKDMSTAQYDGPLRYMQEMLQITKGCDVFFFMIREPQEIRRFLTEIPGSMAILVRRPGIQEFTNHADANVEQMAYDYIIDNSGDLSRLDGQALAFARYLVRGGSIDA